MSSLLGALKSWTIWIAVLTPIITALADPIQQYISAHPSWWTALLGAAFAALRAKTDQSLAEKGAPPPAA
jgi:L-asparagine transporter-like permease